MKITVDIDLCSGCGMCVSFSPEIFGLALDGRAGLKRFSIPVNLEKECFLAIHFCPNHCIRLTDIRRRK